MEVELRTALTEALKELERLRTILLPEYEGKMAEPVAGVITRARNVLDKEISLEEDNQATIMKLFRMLNIMSNDRRLAEQLVEHLPREHRTLQQAFFSTIKTVIEDYSKDQGPAHTDLRNQAAKDWAKRVAEIGLDYYLPCI